jgi:hypothetical protein
MHGRRRIGCVRGSCERRHWGEGCRAAHCAWITRRHWGHGCRAAHCAWNTS